MKKYFIFLTFLLVLIGTGAFLMQSDWSKQMALHFITERVQKSGYKIEITKIEGTFPHALDLSGLKVESETMDISVNSLKIRLSLLSLLKRELLFTDMTAEGITWNVKNGEKGMEKINIPFTIAAREFHAKDLEISKDLKVDLEGSFRLEERNKSTYFELAVKRREDLGRIALHIHKNGLIRGKGSVHIANQDLHFIVHGPLSKLEGRISSPFGTIDFERKDENWELSHILLATDRLTVDGNIAFSLRNKKIEGTGRASGTIDRKPWNGTTLFSWNPSGSL